MLTLVSKDSIKISDHFDVLCVLIACMVLEIINQMSKNQKSSLIVWNTVYYSLMTAFYDTDFALGLILHRHMMGTSRVQEQHQDDLLLNSQVAGSRVCGRSSSR